MRKRRLIKGTIIGLFVVTGFSGFMTRPETSKAAGDDVLAVITNYKSWGRVTKEPFRVIPFSGSNAVAAVRKSDALAIDLRDTGLGG